jgi:hypothetical protein
VHGGRIVAELGRADSEVVVAVRPDAQPRLGAVLGRRRGVVHRHGHPAAHEPVVTLGRRVAGGQGLLDQVETLVEPVAAVLNVLRIFAYGNHRVAGANGVAAAELEWIQVQRAGKLVHRRFDGEDRLAEPVAAHGAGRREVGVNRVCVELLVGAPVDGQRRAAGGVQRLAPVVAVGAGVGDDPHLERRQCAVASRPGLDPHPHRMATRAANELFFARELELDGPAGLQRGQRAEVFGQDLLLAAEAAADALAEHPDVDRVETQQVAKLFPRDERRLGTRPHVQPLVIVEPRDRLVRLEVGVLYPVGRVLGLVDDVGLGEAGPDVAEASVQVEQDVALGMADERVRRLLVVDHRRSGLHRLLGVEDRREHLVVDLDAAAAFLRGGLAVGRHGRHALPDEPHDVVQHVGIVGIDEVVVVDGGGIQAPGTSSQVKTSWTPGVAKAPSLRMATMRAWACGDLSSFRCSRPSTSVSRV